MTVRPAMLRLGDDVELRGVIYRHTALDGDVAMLAVAGEAPVAIKVGSLLADETFRIVGTRPTRRRITGPSMLFDSLPADVQEKARWMEDHMTEVLDGVPCNADTGQTAKRTFDVARTSLRQREQAKLAELHELGETMSIGSLQRLRHAYEKKGVLGLVDRRLIRQTPLAGRTDQRVVDAILSVLDANTHQSSGTTDRLMRQVGKQLEAAYGPDIVPLPARATFRRLIGKLAEGTPCHRVSPNQTYPCTAARTPFRRRLSGQARGADADRLHSPGHRRRTRRRRHRTRGTDRHGRHRHPQHPCRRRPARHEGRGRCPPARPLPDPRADAPRVGPSGINGRLRPALPVDEIHRRTPRRYRRETGHRARNHRLRPRQGLPLQHVQERLLFTAAMDIYDTLASDHPRQANSKALAAAALYPSIVTLSAVIASPYWLANARSSRPDVFLERVSREITDG
jgi:hypothetical protein